MSTHPQTPKIYFHSPPPTHKKYLPTPTTKSIPPSTSIYPYSPIKKHPPNPTHRHQSIKNVHPPPLTQNIPPHTINNHKKVSSSICPKHTSTLPLPSPLTNKKCPPSPTHPKYTTLNHTHPKYSFIQPHSNLTLQTAKLLSQTLTCLGWESSIKYLGGNHTDTHRHTHPFEDSS